MPTFHFDTSRKQLAEPHSFIRSQVANICKRSSGSGYRIRRERRKKIRASSRPLANNRRALPLIVLRRPHGPVFRQPVPPRRFDNLVSMLEQSMERLTAEVQKLAGGD